MSFQTTTASVQLVKKQGDYLAVTARCHLLRQTQGSVSEAGKLQVPDTNHGVSVVLQHMAAPTSAPACPAIGSHVLPPRPRLLASSLAKCILSILSFEDASKRKSIGLSLLLQKKFYSKFLLTK